MSSASPTSGSATASTALTDYEPALRRYFSRRARAEDIDDLIQEVFLRMQSQQGRPDIDHMERYLFRVASNVLTDRARRAAVRHAQDHEAIEEADSPVEDRSPERVILDQEALDRIVAAIQRLPERTREIFVLQRFEEMSCNAIAERLNVSVSAVEKHIMKALAALHRELHGL